jgi:hypothetical protein
VVSLDHVVASLAKGASVKAYCPMNFLADSIGAGADW